MFSIGAPELLVTLSLFAVGLVFLLRSLRGARVVLILALSLAVASCLTPADLLSSFLLAIALLGFLGLGVLIGRARGEIGGAV